MSASPLNLSRTRPYLAATLRSPPPARRGRRYRPRRSMLKVVAEGTASRSPYTRAGRAAAPTPLTLAALDHLRGGWQILPHLEAGEAADDDVLPELGDLALDDVPDGAARVLDELLIQQADGFQCVLAAAVLALQRRLLARRNLVGRDVAGRGSGDLHGEVVRQRAEIGRAGDEVGLAVELDHGADATAAVDVRLDDALLGGAADLLLGL